MVVADLSLNHNSKGLQYMYGHAVYGKEELPFTHDLLLKTGIFLYVLDWFTSFSALFLFPLSTIVQSF